MKNMTLKNIAAACGGIFVGDEDLLSAEITGVEKDSRLIEEGFLYVPFVGTRVDGHDFIDDVFKKGALCTLSEQDLGDIGHPYIRVESTGTALKDIAAFYREQLDCKVVGITGSVGKTSTKEMTASVLSMKFNVLKTEGNFNNEIGEPLTILKIKDSHDVAVVEMGISDFGEMSRLARISKPDIGIITNIGTCHLDNLRDRDGVFLAKTEMFEFISPDGHIILNGDDDKLAQVVESNGIKPEFFGVDTQRDVRIISCSAISENRTRALICCHNEQFWVEIPVPGRHMLYNTLAAVCVGYDMGMDMESIASGIAAYRTVSGRNNIIDTGKIRIIDDCYNANPMSMKSSLEVLSGMRGRKVAILGDMFELGDDEARLHGEIGHYINSLNIDLVICIGKLAGNIASEIRDAETYWFETTEEFNEFAGEYINNGDTVLVKASHGMNFSSIVSMLEDDENIK